MYRYKNYDFERRDSLYEKMLGNGRFEYTSELISSEGAHYHVWIPNNLAQLEEKKYREDFKRAVRNHGDPVSFSWDFLPSDSKEGE